MKTRLVQLTPHSIAPQQSLRVPGQDQSASVDPYFNGSPAVQIFLRPSFPMRSTRSARSLAIRAKGSSRFTT
jgi:hypothetical protein